MERPGATDPGSVSEGAAGDRLDAILSPAADTAASDTTTATGVRRTTIERRQSGRCHACSWRFDNMGAAVSHARASRHLVEATYSATYLYLPPDEPGVTP